MPAVAIEEYPDPKRVLAGRQVALKMLADAVADEITRTRDVLEPQVAGRETVVAQLSDGTAIGTVGRSKPPQRAVVTDPAALLAWVEANRPDEVVHSVRESTVEAWKKQAKTHGHAFDPATGEVIPGIEIVEGSSSFLPKPDEDQRGPVLSALFGGMADSGVLAELPEANGEVA